MEALTGESTKMVRENGVYVCVPEILGKAYKPWGVKQWYKTMLEL